MRLLLVSCWCFVNLELGCCVFGGGRGVSDLRVACRVNLQINPYFGTKGHAGGAEQLIDWLDWAIVTHNIQQKMESKTEVVEGPDGGQEVHVTRVFSPQTFRALLKHGSNV